MAQPRFSECFIPDPVRILGVRLRPFSFGHMILMDRFGCNLSPLDEMEAPSIFDLVLGIMICSRSFAEFIELADNSKMFVAESKRISKRIKLKELAPKAQLFGEYMRDGMRSPKYWMTDKPSGQTGAPLPLAVIMLLMCEMRLSEQEALDMPASRALWYCTALGERKGQARLWTKQDEAAQEAAARFDERIRNGDIKLS